MKARARTLLGALGTMLALALVVPGAVWAGSKAQIKVEEAKVEFSAGRFEQALGLLREALADEPDNAEALQYAGLCAMELKDPGQAASYLERAAAKLPGDAGLQEDLAWASVESKNFDQALAAADRALAINPASERAKLFKGQALMGLRRYDEAIAELSGISESGEYGQASLFFQAMCVSYQGKTQDAAAMFDRAAALDPGSAIGVQAAQYASVLRGGAPVEETKKPWSFRFRVMYQYDSNMTLSESEDILPEDVSNREDSRTVLDLDARYTFVDADGFKAYARYVGYQSFQFNETALNITYNVGQVGLFQSFDAGVPMMAGVKADYTHSLLEGYWYESFYRVSPEVRMIWSDTFMTRLVGNWKEETFEEPGDRERSRNNKSAGGAVYAHFAFMDGDLSTWVGYGYAKWMGAGQNYNRYENSGMAGLTAQLPLDIMASLVGSYEATEFMDYQPGDRRENQTSVALAAEVPIYEALKLYLGVNYSTVDANETRWEYERWIYSGGVFVEL